MSGWGKLTRYTQYSFGDSISPFLFCFSEGFEQGRGGARGFENLLCFKWPITPAGKGEGARGHKRLIQYGMAELCVEWGISTVHCKV